MLTKVALAAHAREKSASEAKPWVSCSGWGTKLTLPSSVDSSVTCAVKRVSEQGTSVRCRETRDAPPHRSSR